MIAIDSSGFLAIRLIKVKDLAAKFWKSLIWCRRFARVARDGRCTKKHADASNTFVAFTKSASPANRSLTVTHPMFCTAKSKLCFVNDTKYWMHYIEVNRCQSMEFLVSHQVSNLRSERWNGFWSCTGIPGRDFLGSKKSWRTRLLVLACDLSPIFKSRVSIAVDALLLLVVGRLCTEIIKAVAFTSVARFEPIALSFLLLTRHTCFSHSLTALRFGSHPYGNRLLTCYKHLRGLVLIWQKLNPPLILPPMDISSSVFIGMLGCKVTGLSALEPCSTLTIIGLRFLVALKIQEASPLSELLPMMECSFRYRLFRSKVKSTSVACSVENCIDSMTFCEFEDLFELGIEFEVDISGVATGGCQDGAPFDRSYLYSCGTNIAGSTNHQHYFVGLHMRSSKHERCCSEGNTNTGSLDERQFFRFRCYCVFGDNAILSYQKLLSQADALVQLRPSLRNRDLGFAGSNWPGPVPA
ncbi:hypothetical protein KCV06_g696, partial [Aureobasidium melanogenum]